MPITVQVAAVVLAHAVGAWLITYLLHSTVLILIAHGIERLRVQPALHAVVWRTAIFGPVLTASIHTSLPFGSPFRMSAAPAGAVLGPRPLLALLVVAAWCVLIGMRAVGALRAELRGQAALALRRPCRDPALTRRLRSLCRRTSGMRRMPLLTTSHRIVSPVVLASAEICVPDGFDLLPAAQQDALLAHEFAHIVRRDPLWCGLAHFITRLCSFQPLNRGALARLRTASEFAADAHAVRTTGDARSLALALEHLATRALAAFELRGAATHTAASGSPLVQRIRVILDSGTATPCDVRPRTAAALITLLLGLCLAVGPGVNFSPDDAANSIPSLRPSRAEPGPDMIRMREVTRSLRSIEILP
ncbi:MAG: M56 family metallopeptidase [Gemmatimonadota bacterium]